MKLIIDIPEEDYKRIISRGLCSTSWNLVNALVHGTPLDSVKAEIKEKCDRIDDIARANIYQYAPHREIQELLCEILESIDNAESEDI